MSGRSLTCQHCRHFDDDAASLEQRLAHLAIFGSAYSSTRGAAGLCAATGRFLEPVPAEECPRFAQREAAPSDP